MFAKVKVVLMVMVLIDNSAVGDVNEDWPYSGDSE
jgi:hypothetical protein